MWNERGHRSLIELVFSSHLATVLAAMARDGRGIVFSPLSLIRDDLAAGRLVQVGEADDVVSIAIHLFRPKARQTKGAEAFWSRFCA